ncbi:hypothetical protein BHE74_00045697 [Ensete ventricosum]|nr:hypothetical protein BHE74_00045697 [Ensete ventricosum]
MGELLDAWDDCLEHFYYGLDLVGKSLKSFSSSCRDPEIQRGGVSPGSLNRRQYRPGVWEGGFLSPNKGRRGGGCGLPPKPVASRKGRLPGGC